MSNDISRTLILVDFILDFILWSRQKHFTLKGLSQNDLKEIVEMYFAEQDAKEAEA